MAASSTDTTEVATGNPEATAGSPAVLSGTAGSAQGTATGEVTGTVTSDPGATETGPEPRGEAPEPQLTGTGAPSAASGDLANNGAGGVDQQEPGKTTPISARDGSGGGANQSGSGGAAKASEITLVRPSGASEAVLAYIGLAETVIQRAVDLLGQGMPEPPPDVGKLLEPQVYETLGKGKAAEKYEETLSRVEAKKTELQSMDSQVQQTSATVAAGQDKTLRKIEAITAKLNTTLEAVSGVDLKPAQETALMDHIAQAVEAVYTEVDNASQINSEMAGEKSGGSGGGGQGGGGQGGGGLESILPMLAMAPMALMPLATQLLPELLGQGEEEDEQKDGEQGKPGDPPADPNAPPADPNAPAPEGSPAPEAAAPPGEPPAEPDQPNPSSPTPAIPSPGTLV